MYLAQLQKNHILSVDPVGLPLSRKAESISWLVTHGALKALRSTRQVSGGNLLSTHTVSAPCL